jgi:hypothetical protein
MTAVEAGHHPLFGANGMIFGMQLLRPQRRDPAGGCLTRRGSVNSIAEFSLIAKFLLIATVRLRGHVFRTRFRSDSERKLSPPVRTRNAIMSL